MPKKTKKTRLVPFEELAPFAATARKPVHQKIGLKLARSKVPDYSTADAVPEVAIERPCMRKKHKTLRPCHVELVFVGETMTKERGVKVGSYLQLCTVFGKPGKLVPVKDHVEAHEVAQRFCACRKADSAEACAAKLVGGDLGEAKRRGEPHPVRKRDAEDLVAMCRRIIAGRPGFGGVSRKRKW